MSSMQHLGLHSSHKLCASLYVTVMAVTAGQCKQKYMQLNATKHTHRVWQ